MIKRDEQTGKEVIIGIYVDDLAVCTNDIEMANATKAELLKEFVINDYGELKEFLGLELIRDRGHRKIFVHQLKYLIKILEKFRMLNAKTIGTPMAPKLKLVSLPDEAPVNTKLQGPYRMAVGSLIYLTMGSRPDISGSIAQESRFCHKPGQKHWDAVKYTMRYLAGHKDYGIVLGGDIVGKGLVGYADANHAGDLEMRISKKTGLLIEGGKSTSGIIFFWGDGPVSWRSKKQTRVTAVATMEAEVVSLFEAAREAAFLRGLSSEICKEMRSDREIICHEDNTQCITQCTRGTLTDRSKHFRVEYFYVTEQKELGYFDFPYKETKEMIADTFTKPLEKGPFDYLRSKYMMSKADFLRKIRL